MYRESLKSAKHVARSKREACLWKTTYRRSTEGQKNLKNGKAPASCCLTLEPEKRGVGIVLISTFQWFNLKYDLFLVSYDYEDF